MQIPTVRRSPPIALLGERERQLTTPLFQKSWVVFFEVDEPP